ncbi:hypothetical protein EYR36_003123 [Pleurotus pulmonarius]|nr:hypothetical protein EYR36_003123 [Pleurotus pulmonarius]KAF4582517.1 hypothetical protein EYR38_002643 [Pleurotus pulmonarius]
MFPLRFFFLFSLLALPTHGVVYQPPAPTAAVHEAAVPTGTPIVGNYTGHFRPQVHFSPPVGFMNDPNGLFRDASGTYHLYYQYNPTAVVAGNQHWGHATSTDLYHWTNQPIALFPHLNVTGIFTGSIVVDVNNTSGFFPNQTNGVVAIYTGDGSDDENQRLAFSTDGGFTFEQFSGNPVLPIGSRAFRDPKVIWHKETRMWVMSVAFANDRAIGFFTSPNLRDWTHASSFTFHVIGDVYECPNMLPVPLLEEDGSVHETVDLLWISINPGAPLGGSISQYFPGHFNGTHFTAVDEEIRLADFGKDNYATQFWYGVDGDPLEGGALSIAWASNAQYANDVPTGPEGWRSSMSLPRRNFLKNDADIGWTLVSNPFDLGPAIGAELASNDSLANGILVAQGGANESNANTGTFVIAVNITNINSSTLRDDAAVTFTISSSSSGETLKARQNLSGNHSLVLDRSNTRAFTNSGFNPRIETELVFSEEWDMVMTIDRSVWEVFVLGGKRSATLLYFPEGILDRVEVATEGLDGQTQVSVRINELNGTWRVASTA